jgi:hypothetical protein
MREYNNSCSLGKNSLCHIQIGFYYRDIYPTCHVPVCYTATSTVLRCLSHKWLRRVVIGQAASLCNVLVIENNNDCGGRPNGMTIDAEDRSWMLVDINKDFAAFYL